MIKIALIQHEDSTPLGSTFEWLIKNQIPHELFHTQKKPNHFPKPEEFDGLIIAGGSMNVDDELKYPWLKQEKEYIQRFINKNKKIFGLCLGSQLLAEALGGTVQPNSDWEIGWHKVNILSDQNGHQKKEQELVVFQWHKFGFTIPAGAKTLASNLFSDNQAFTFENQIVATQFHPEATLSWVGECANDSQLSFILKNKKNNFIQNKFEILENANYQPAMKNWYFSKLSRLFETEL